MSSLENSPESPHCSSSCSPGFCCQNHFIKFHHYSPACPPSSAPPPLMSPPGGKIKEITTNRNNSYPTRMITTYLSYCNLDFSCDPRRTIHSLICINKLFKLLFGDRNCSLGEGLKPNRHDKECCVIGR
ncbi:hypothetical protein ILYODFUR_018738 [Ilyodon furcidens]|uniref:Uncharacterized protein n=1 Tax=Ilyodon furcidens TaxID=33524 RepID=A0ABV0TNC7_9TELE